MALTSEVTEQSAKVQEKKGMARDVKNYVKYSGELNMIWWVFFHPKGHAASCLPALEELIQVHILCCPVRHGHKNPGRSEMSVEFPCEGNVALCVQILWAPKHSG